MPLFTKSQQIALALAPKCSAILSLIGSLWIIIEVTTDQLKRSTVFHRLLLGMSCIDIVSSLAYFASTWPIPKDDGDDDITNNIVWAIGNDATCTMQGFFMQVGIASPIYNALLAIYYQMIIHFGYTENRIRDKYERGMHFLAALFALVPATIGLQLHLYHEANVWCWIAPDTKTIRLVDANKFNDDNNFDDDYYLFDQDDDNNNNNNVDDAEGESEMDDIDIYNYKYYSHYNFTEACGGGDHDDFYNADDDFECVTPPIATYHGFYRWAFYYAIIWACLFSAVISLVCVYQVIRKRELAGGVNPRRGSLSVLRPPGFTKQRNASFIRDESFSIYTQNSFVVDNSTSSTKSGTTDSVVPNLMSFSLSWGSQASERQNSVRLDSINNNNNNLHLIEPTSLSERMNRGPSLLMGNNSFRSTSSISKSLAAASRIRRQISGRRERFSLSRQERLVRERQAAAEKQQEVEAVIRAISQIKSSTRLSSVASSYASRQVYDQALLYTFAFLITYSFATVNRIVQEITGISYFPLMLLHVIFMPLQGSLNFLVYRRNAYRKLKLQYPHLGVWQTFLRTWRWSFLGPPKPVIPSMLDDDNYAKDINERQKQQQPQPQQPKQQEQQHTAAGGALPTILQDTSGSNEISNSSGDASSEKSSSNNDNNNNNNRVILKSSPPPSPGSLYRELDDIVCPDDPDNFNENLYMTPIHANSRGVIDMDDEVNRVMDDLLSGYAEFPNLLTDDDMISTSFPVIKVDETFEGFYESADAAFNNRCFTCPPQHFTS